MYEYLSYQPESKAKEPLPLLVFLHGAPQRGDIEALRNVELPVLLEQKVLDLPMYVLAPLCPKNEMWKPQEIMKVIDDFSQKKKIDRKRIYIMGFSMGGFGALKVIKEYPHFFAAGISVCGGGIEIWAEKLKDTPLWFFHGRKDDIIEINKTEELVDALKDVGANPKFTIFENKTHRIWDIVFRDKQIYSWLLEHSR